jgi:hypothetical protein
MPYLTVPQPDFSFDGFQSPVHRAIPLLSESERLFSKKKERRMRDANSPASFTEPPTPLSYTPKKTQLDTPSLLFLKKKFHKTGTEPLLRAENIECDSFVNIKGSDYGGSILREFELLNANDEPNSNENTMQRENSNGIQNANEMHLRQQSTKDHTGDFNEDQSNLPFQVGNGVNLDIYRP